MGDVKKWSVTYTKHLKQKRKVYHDGFLELQSSNHKAMLYDDCEKLLGIKILKNDDDVKTGETLPFDSYLVDIGDPHGDYKPIPKLNTKLMNKKVPVESGLLHSGKSSAAVDNRKSNLGKRKAPPSNLSPSQKIIREFKKSEACKYGSSPGYLDTTKSSTEGIVHHTNNSKGKEVP
uniref:Protein ZGRF1-like isoform X2 n=1 Tax=Nicotiana sylvestris TaxID=4096 RepID=A0A1U7WZB4_NICSY|nr:PREDICTED: protein ZGRF1-like isoform X2 [Nicotiana sylvestris]